MISMWDRPNYFYNFNNISPETNKININICTFTILRYIYDNNKKLNTNIRKIVYMIITSIMLFIWIN